MKLVALLLLVSPLLGACGGDGDHRPCLQGHQSTHLIPITTWSGKVPITTYVYTNDFHCDQYAPEEMS